MSKVKTSQKPAGGQGKAEAKAATRAAALKTAPSRKEGSSDSYGLHWFRRDLRVAGNAGLAWSQGEHQGRVLGFFCWEGASQCGQPGYPANQNLFLLRTVAALKAELEARGSGLLFFAGQATEAVATCLDPSRLPKAPATVSWNRCYELAALQREEALQSFLTARGIVAMSERDQLLIEPHEIYKASNKRQPYQVFTPFSRQWLKVFSTSEVQTRLGRQTKALKEFARRAAVSPDFQLPEAGLTAAKFYQESSQRLDAAIAQLESMVTIPLPPAGAAAAYRQLKSFASELDDYHLQRDIPSLPGTSRFSVYLNNGSLTIDQVIASYQLNASEAAGSGRQKFLGELIWREFYYYILTRFPHCETEPFHTRYRALRWENREDWFMRWKEGRTGYPIVDAGMRQLLSTGWMHNRVRMIVASFLCKDLLIDWRWGEMHFLEHLIDGDPALNNGGWQWAASTGCDPQPYFRIFNPELQSQRFDPEGIYIKRYVPELAHLSAREIHRPPVAAGPGAYPAPIVDHAVQKPRALALYKAVR